MTQDEKEKRAFLQDAYLKARGDALAKERPFPEDQWKYQEAWDRVCKAEAPFRKKLVEFENYLEVKYGTAKA